jgi:hypothetical protein
MCALNPSPLRYNGFNAHILGFLRLIIHPINQVLFFREFGRLVGHKIFLTALLHHQAEQGFTVLLMLTSPNLNPPPQANMPKALPAI